MAGHRPDFEDRSQIKRQKRGMELKEESGNEEEATSESADDEDGGVLVPKYSVEKPVKVEGQVSNFNSQ